MEANILDNIEPSDVITLHGLFKERVKRSGNNTAYRHYDKTSTTWQDTSWNEAATRVAKMQAAIAKENLVKGDRVAIMAPNCPNWVHFEQAALGLGLVVVPLYTNDRADNIAYVLQDSGTKILFIEGHEQLQALDEIASQMDGLVRIVSINPCKKHHHFSRLKSLDEWFDELSISDNDLQLQSVACQADDLATIVYTSGTTGRPKGVMLSHNNILQNTDYGTKSLPIYCHDIFLSFLPLSHTLERMAGYYIPMLTGATMAFARSVQDLGEDLITIKPTVLVSVPRIYERVQRKIFDQLELKSNFAQKLFHKAVETGWLRFKKPGSSSLTWFILNSLVAKKVMAKLGGRLRIAICGGAPLSPSVAKTFIGLGLNLYQGYGLTETSPVIGVNTKARNEPASVGPALENVEIKIGENDELLTRGPCVMLGYWHNKKATDEMIDKDGWLHTGDKARIDDGLIFITGRIKEILVLSNGEKVPPNDMEQAIAMDPLFEQLMVLGEGRPCLTALAVLNIDQWRKLANSQSVASDDPAVLKDNKILDIVLQRISLQIKSFPGYAQIKRVALSLDPWTVENGLITPTLKLKRNRISDHFKQDIENFYAD